MTARTATRKAWGTTEPLIREPHLHADRIIVKPGGFCSIHRHASKANVFHVLAGSLMVSQLAVLNASAYKHTLCAGQSRAVEAGVWHQFWCYTACEAIEVYLPPGLEQIVDAEDIERHPACKLGGIVTSSVRLDDMWAKAFGAVLAVVRS